MKFSKFRLRDLAGRPFSFALGHRRQVKPHRPVQPLCEPLEPRVVLSQNLVVTNTADSGTGSLRAALMAANGVATPSHILFDIPTTDPGFVDVHHSGKFQPGDYWSIAPAAALPSITASVFLDGWSQGGHDYHGRPLIELNGSGAGDGVDGLVLDGGQGSTVRGLDIDRFGGNGIVIQGGGRDTLTGDFLGTDVTGTVALGNGFAGVFITASSFNIIGGTGPGERDLISGNQVQGVHIEGTSSVGNHILGDLIGTDISGDIALGNGPVNEPYIGDGVRIEGARFNLVGGAGPGEGNVLSANTSDGIDIREGAMGNVVIDNNIGTDASGTLPLANHEDGVYLQGASDNLIGGLISGDANVIGGNGDNGIFLYGSSDGNVIAGNFIGTNARHGGGLGNGSNGEYEGVFLWRGYDYPGTGYNYPTGPSNNVIISNTITNSSASGITVGLSLAENSTGNSVLGNSIYGNNALGIDLGSDTNPPLPNDPGDTDTGPNNLQNYPVLASPTAHGHGTFTATGTLNSLPNTLFRIELFANPVPASTAYAQGETYLGFVNVVTDKNGNAAFSFTYNAVTGQPVLTATATNLQTGDTSEFSAAVQPAQPGPLALADGSVHLTVGPAISFGTAVGFAFEQVAPVNPVPRQQVQPTLADQVDRWPALVTNSFAGFSWDSMDGKPGWSLEQIEYFTAFKAKSP
jgi:hypothetical protein